MWQPKDGRFNVGPHKNSIRVGELQYKDNINKRRLTLRGMLHEAAIEICSALKSVLSFAPKTRRRGKIRSGAGLENIKAV